MGRLPHIPDVDVPRAVLELADLSNVHPAPIVANLHFILVFRTSCIGFELQ